MSASRRTITIAIAVALSFGALPAITACSAIGGAVKEATNGQVDVGGTEIPEGFPAEVPVIDGQIVSAGSVGDNSGRVFNVTVQVADAAAFEQITTELTDAELAAEGQLSPGTAEGGTAAFTSAGYGVLVVVSKDLDNGFVANYTVTAK